MGGKTQTKDTNSAFNQNLLQQFQNASTGASSGTTSPWAAAQPFLGGILAQLQGALPTAAITPAEENALERLSASSGYISQFLPATTGLASNLLAGGNAQAYAPLAQGAYSQYAAQLNPYLQSSFLDPRNTPGFADVLAATNADITNQVNGMFAGAGRDLSGLNQQALARGLAQGEGALIANQYNQNVAKALDAMQSAYGAGNTTAGLLSSLNQQALANQQAGLGVAQTGQNFAAAPYQAQLAEEAARRSIPLAALRRRNGRAARGARQHHHRRDLRHARREHVEHASKHRHQDGNDERSVQSALASSARLPAAVGHGQPESRRRFLEQARPDRRLNHVRSAQQQRHLEFRAEAGRRARARQSERR